MWPTASVSQKTHLGGTLTSQDGHVATASVSQKTHLGGTLTSQKGYVATACVPEDTSWRYTHVAGRTCG